MSINGILIFLVGVGLLVFVNVEASRLDRPIPIAANVGAVLFIYGFAQVGAIGDQVRATNSRLREVGYVLSQIRENTRAPATASPMPMFVVRGADRKTGATVVVHIEASTDSEAATIANARQILVSEVEQCPY